jgi:hypothetical protein
VPVAARELAAIDTAVVVAQLALAPHQTVAEFPFINSVVKAQFAAARHQAVGEITLVDVAVFPCDAAPAVQLAIRERAVIASAVGGDGVGRGCRGGVDGKGENAGREKDA